MCDAPLSPVIQGGDWSARGICQSFLKLIVTGGALTADDSAYYLFVFAAGCVFVSVLFLLLDICHRYVRNKSFLRFPHHSGRRWYHPVLAYPSASAITGLVGAWLHVLQPTIEACIAVSFAWHLLLLALFGEGDADTDTEDTEAGTDE